MHKLFRLTTHRLHQAQLGVLVPLGGILIHQARTALSNLDLGSGLWTDMSWKVLSSGLDYVFFGGILVVLGVVLVYVADARSEPALPEPLQDILQCAEAAAAGDTTRVPGQESNEEARPLAQAVGRLITVLARSETLVYHLAALVESADEAIISLGLDGNVLSWNKGAQRIYGYSADEVKGRSITLLSPADEGAALTENLEKIRNGERIQPFETLHQARNGRTVKALLRVSAILDSTRQVIGASFCAQELTDAAQPQLKITENSQTI